MSTDTKKYPAPVYAAAAAGDLAYQQLRKLPGKLTELRGQVSTNEFDIRGDLQKFGKNAQRNASAMLDEAKKVYANLVKRGEKVVAGERTPAAEIDSKPAPAKATKRTAGPKSN